ncbi:MAG: rhodanese-like domain-containing protein [Candidatus Marinimicrobia bacterium]|nr:rhodanese-like domain-containing protein [Candidatus Neomarinimicrobiota bacterium]
MYNLDFGPNPSPSPRLLRMGGAHWLLSALLLSGTIGCSRSAESGSHNGAVVIAAISGESVAQLHAQQQNDPATFILDVRTPGEFDGPLGHIEGARLIPVQELAQRLAELQDVQDGLIHVVCRSGNRSGKATKILLEAGFEAVNVEGGMRAWRQAYPISE